MAADRKAFRIPKSQAAALRAQAKREGVSVSALVRDWVDEWAEGETSIELAQPEETEAVQVFLPASIQESANRRAQAEHGRNLADVLGTIVTQRIR